MEHLSPRLSKIVRQSVALLGEVIRIEFGRGDYRLIEGVRSRMASLRGASTDATVKALRRERAFLRGLGSERQFRVAQAFTLMLELMNSCENAYRSTQLHRRMSVRSLEKPDSVIYVLTAHPTEARAPDNIKVFHEILRLLTEVLGREDVELTRTEQERLRFLLAVALRTRVVRPRKPEVRDEADHIYATLLRDETLRPLLRASEELAPVYVRSWVGGDKDGHPGVDESVFTESLRLSRAGLVLFCRRRLREIGEALKTVGGKDLLGGLKELQRNLDGLGTVAAGDGRRLVAFRKAYARWVKHYVADGGPVPHPSLIELKRLFHVFPALVVPLEFRESSDVLMASKEGQSLAIDRMLRALAVISRGTDPLWYVRGFIISQASQIEHLEAAAGLVRRRLGGLKIPIIPLFEQLDALSDAPKIVREILEHREFRAALRTHWGSKLEVMLGYSDSSKECGVLKSRLKIAETMHAIEQICLRQKVTPLFFHGSGGSTDRGGGSIDEQTAWWSASALRNYKVTIQGEMVERSLANPEITRGQIERIVQSAARWKSVGPRALPPARALDQFADAVASHYMNTVRDRRFLAMVEKATPYPYLSLLRFGSRPSARAKEVSLKALRAIPWILCWTQTRVLLPTWWGVGKAWRSATQAERRELAKAARRHPVFAMYVRALGFTLAKVELAIWALYLESSALPKDEIESLRREFQLEYRGALSFVRAMLGTTDLIPWRPWLAESIKLRSPMIHPLNLLQLIAMERGDVGLLRLSVAGVASGMMTTG